MAKILKRLFDNTSDRIAENRSSARRSKTSIDPVLGAEGRHWPTLPAAPRNDLGILESTVAKQAAELNLRCTQIAELCNIQRQQADELQIACEEIDRLNSTISALLDTTTQYETEAADTKRIIIYLEKEKAWLRAQLDKALEESGQWSRRLLAIETMFNDRETTIASALEKVELLKAELTAVSAEKFTLVAAMESEKQRHRGELNEQRSIFENRISAIESAGASQNMRIKGLEEERESLAKRVGVLEALLRSEREAAEFKIQELAEELQRERVDHSIADRASAAMRKEIVFLLPKLAAQKKQSDAPEPEIAPVHHNAA